MREIRAKSGVGEGRRADDGLGGGLGRSGMGVHRPRKAGVAGSEGKGKKGGIGKG